MAENTYPLLSFGYGQKANLPSEHTQGKIYITTDTKEMYIDLPGAEDRLRLSNFSTGDTLPASGESGQFFVKFANGVSTLYHYNGGWKEIVDTKALSDLRTDLGNKTDAKNASGSAFARIAQNAADIDALESALEQHASDAAKTYLKLDGSNDPMTGDLAMGSHKITGLANAVANTDAANLGQVTSAVSTHAAVKATSTALGHVTLSDATNSNSDASKGIAATPKAVKDAYDLASAAKSVAEGIDLTPYVKHNGTVAMTGNLNLGSKKIINLAEPEANTDAATKKYVDDLFSDIVGGDDSDKTISERVGDLETSLGAPVADDKANAGGTAYERIAKNKVDIAKNASDIADLSQALDTFEDTTAPATYLKLDGSNSPMTGNLAMGSYKITGLTDGSAATDAATVGNVTSAVSAAKTAILGQENGADFGGTVKGAYDAAGSAASAAQQAMEEAQKKADKNHASGETTYGVGNGTLYGHVKLSDNSGDSGVSAGIAATPKAVKTAVADHADDAATSSALGHVKLSDATNSDSDASKGIAASPKAVKTVADIANANASAIEGLEQAKLALEQADKDTNARIDSIKGITDALPTTYLKLNGESAMTGDLKMGAKKITGLANGVADNDAATVAQVNAVSSALAGAVEDIDARIDPIEEIIAGISGSPMDFVGISTTDPAGKDGVTITNKPDYVPADGDVVIYKDADDNTIEYIYSNGTWVELGDVSAETRRIGAVEEAVEEINSEISDLGTIRQDIAGLKSADTSLDGRIDVLEAAKNTNDGNISNLQGRVAALETTTGNHTTLIDGLRTDLGQTTEDAQGSGSAFARIADVRSQVAGLDSEMTAVVQILTWDAF